MSRTAERPKGTLSISPRGRGGRACPGHRESPRRPYRRSRALLAKTEPVPFREDAEGVIRWYALRAMTIQLDVPDGFLLATGQSAEEFVREVQR